MPNSERPSRRVHRRLAALALAALTFATVAAPAGVAATDGDPLGPAPFPTRDGGPPPGTGDVGAPEYTGRLIVKYADGVGSSERSAVRRAQGLTLVDSLPLPNTEVVASAAGAVAQVMTRLDRSAEIVWVEREQRLVHMGGPSAEQRFAEQWALHNTGQVVGGYAGVRDVDMNLPEAWQITTGSPDVVVAVIDDGVDLAHPDLATQVWLNPGETAVGSLPGVDDDDNGYVDDVNGWDFCSGDATVHDAEDSHGTHVAGSIAAAANDLGVTGVAPGIRVMALKFIKEGDPECGTISAAVEAITYAAAHGATIINASWGAYGYSAALEEAIAAVPNTLVVAAAGNERNDNDLQPLYPASYDLPNVLSVASIHNQGHLSGFTNVGFATVDIAAPGEDILSALPAGSWDLMSGTSMAAAHASGVAALAVSAKPGLANGAALHDHLVATGRALPTARGWIASPRLLDARASVVSRPDVRRLAGGNRYATAAAISAATFAPQTPYLFVATGAAFPDALAGGAVAAQLGAPLLLTARDSIPAATLAEITRLKPAEIFVMGGSSAVSTQVVDQLATLDNPDGDGIPNNDPQPTRLGGSNRFGTAAAVADHWWGGYSVGTVFIATGRNFPDALAGVPATAVRGGPLLLVNPDNIPAATHYKLIDLQPQSIVILGGPSVVSDEVARQLREFTSGPVSRWAGSNRFGTAAAVANGAFPSAETVFVANGMNFPDALAGGPAAGAYGGPLLLVTATSAPSQTLGQLDRLQPARVFILGGTSVVPNTVVNQMKAVFD